MRISYDPEADALSIVFSDTTVTTEEWADGVVAEHDAAGRLAALEFLDASKRFGDLSTFQQVVVEGLEALPQAGKP
jgi:uncharacterized protein YuzE